MLCLSGFELYPRWVPLNIRHARSYMMCDIIVFENFRFRPSTRKRKADVFKNLHS